MNHPIHSTETVNRHLVRRICTYILGIFLAATSTNLSILAGFGLSAFNSMSTIISAQTGVSLGDMIILVNCSMVVLQFVLLGRDFQLINLGQVPFAILYGKFVVLLGHVFPSTPLTVWYQQVIVLLLTVLVMATGILIYVGTELVPMPVEGACLVVASKTGIAFHNVKIMSDCTFLVIALALALYFYGNLASIGIGTVVLAFGAGWVMGKIKRFLPRWIQNWHLQ